MKKRIFLQILMIFFVSGLFLSRAALCAYVAQRIISLSPSVTEQLYQLGAQDLLIGCTVYCNRPLAAKDKEKVGTIIEINTEKIVSLKPDLVIVTSLANPKAVDKLKRLGIKVVAFPPAESFDALCSQHLALATLVGKEDLAQESINRARYQARILKENVKGLSKPGVFVQVGANPLVTATNNSIINDFIEYAGGANIASTAATGLFSREDVIKKNPDVILIVAMGIAQEEEMRIWRKYGTINAVRNSRIYIIDANAICSPTPVSFITTLKELMDLLHPPGELKPGA